MTDNHKSKQKGVGAFRGGRNENHDDRNLTSNNRFNGNNTQLPPLTPLIQRNSVEQQHLKQQPKEMKAQNASPLSPPTWQEQPAKTTENNAADKFSPSEKKEPVTKSFVDTTRLFSEQGQEQYNDNIEDFCLFENYQNDTDLYLFAPPTPKSLLNSPSMPTEPRPPLLDSFDSDEETSYDTAGFFPSLSSIGRRPH